MNYYCAIDTVGPEVIWGLGSTPDEAMLDAAAQLADWNRGASACELVLPEDLTYFPCSKEVHDAVNEEGGDITFVYVTRENERVVELQTQQR